MIESLKQTRGPAYGFAVKGSLTAADIEEVSKEIEFAIGKDKKPIGLLADMTEMTGGAWSARWKEMRFLQRHTAQIARLAVIGVTGWEEVASMVIVATAALQAETRYYHPSEILHAWHWVKMGKHDDETPVRLMYSATGLFHDYTPEYMGI